MTGIDAPRRVRLAARLTWLMAPLGLLLLLVGVLELSWWGSGGSRRLVALLAQLRQQYGIQPPALLRDRAGAVELIILGVVCIAYASLGLGLLRGRLWARTWAFVLGGGTLLWGLIGVGGDASVSPTLADYFKALTDSAIGDQVPAVRALLFPGWYSWIEDIAQGLQVLGSLAALIALTAAVIANSDYFVGKPSPDAPPDEWDNALSRIRDSTVRDSEID
jgi:hypothetical protein